MTQTLSSALAKAQAEMHNAPLNKVNPHFKSKYADLPAIRDAVIPALSKNGIAVTQTPTFRDGAFVLVTALRMGDEVIEAVYPLPINDKIQQQGSALTYARRYCLAAICGIAADEDDDGNAAQESDAKPRAPLKGTKNGTLDQRVISSPEMEKEVREKAEEWTNEKANWLMEADTHAELQIRWEKLSGSEAFSRLGKKHADLCETLEAARSHHESNLYGKVA